MKTCPKCNKTISDYALTCPYCNNPDLDNAPQNKKSASNYKLLIISLLIIPALIISVVMIFLFSEQDTAEKKYDDLLSQVQKVEEYNSQINNTSGNADTSMEPQTNNVENYVYETIKATLKNPSSFTANNITYIADTLEDEGYYYYYISVDYSAQNGFGGYNRETKSFYVKSSKNSTAVSIIDDIEYYNSTNAFRYKKAFDSLEQADKIPFSLMCSANTYSSVADFLKQANIEYTIYNYSEKKPQEITYPCTLLGYNGIVKISFNENNRTVSNISFYVSNSQIYYDANKNETVTITNDKIMSEDYVKELKNDITTALNLSGKEKDEYGLSQYTSHSCVWDLSPALTAKLKWDKLIEDNSVIYLSFTITNALNEKAGA